MGAFGVAAVLRPGIPALEGGRPADSAASVRLSGPAALTPPRPVAVRAAAPAAAEPTPPRAEVRGLVAAGLAAAQGADLAEAARLLREAIGLDPADPEAWNALGVVLVRQGEVPRGLEAFRRALRRAPRHAEAHRNLAAALDAQGRSGEAVRHYRAYLQASPESDPRRPAVERRLAALASRRGAE